MSTQSSSGRWSTRKGPLWTWPDYHSAINWACQTALRDVIGKTDLSEMLEGRDRISQELQKIIDERTEPWGHQGYFR